MTASMKVEPRDEGIHLLEITFSEPMDEASCEDPANISVVDHAGNPVTVTTSAELDPGGTVLRVTLVSGPLGDQECYVFDLAGMGSVGGSPWGDSTFAIVALEGDVDGDLAVTAIDEGLVTLHFGETASEAAGNVQFDVVSDGVIAITDRAFVLLRVGNSAPDCGQ
jgi:hypothetical protein